ncbi:MAG: MaoC family dehydratase [Proteobacteria bacterium]|nr:MaoC family dehydratase [Pseudomonadota bacterium]
MAEPSKYFEDFAPGAVARLGPRHITAAEIKSFAARFDPLPMHLDDVAARASIMEGLCASGWHLCALTMRLIADGILRNSASMGAPGVEELRWLKPVRPGDELTLHTRVLDTRVSESRPRAGFVRLEIVMVNGAGDRVMTMVTTLMQRRRDGTAG